MAEVDYYKTLGVSRNATPEEIRKAYKKLARENHPDLRPNDKQAAERFKQIQEANDVLSDSEKREQYDRYGSAYFGKGGRGPQGQGGWSPGPGAGGGQMDFGDIFGGQVDLGDLFGDVFGGGGGAGAGGRRRARQSRARKGQDVRATTEVPFTIAALGGKHDIHIQRDGKSERLTVKIPPGINTGGVIRLAGQGEAGGNGGPAGDLLVTIQVSPHPYFRREGNHLYLDLPVTPSEAALGSKIEVPTLSEGKVVLTIPSGASSGTKLRLRGKGVPDQKSGQFGDQYVVVKIIIPQSLSDEARTLFEELSKVAPQSPRENLW